MNNKSIIKDDYTGAIYTIPDGWYRLSKGAIIKAGDKVVYYATDKWCSRQTVYSVGARVKSAIYIRRYRIATPKQQKALLLGSRVRDARLLASFARRYKDAGLLTSHDANTLCQISIDVEIRARRVFANSQQ